MVSKHVNLRFFMKLYSHLKPGKLPVMLLLFFTSVNCMGQKIIQQRKLVGLVSSKGDTLLKPVFTEIKKMENEDFFLLKKKYFTGICDTSGKIIVPVNFETVELKNENNQKLFFARRNKTEVEYSLTGKEISASYPDKIGKKYISNGLNSSLGLLVYQDDNSKQGIMNDWGDVIVQAVYDEIAVTEIQHLFSVKQGDFFGIIDINGKEIIPVSYDSEIKCRGKFCYTEKNELHGLRSIRGKEIQTPSFMYALDLDDPLNIAYLPGQKYGLIDSAGILRSNKAYDVIYMDNDGKVGVTVLNNQYGLVGTTGLIFDSAYDEMSKESQFDHIYHTKKDNLHGLVNVNGTVILPCTYSEPIFLSDDFTVIENNGKHGLLAKDSLLFECIFDEKINSSLKNRYFIVKLNGKYGMYDVKKTKILDLIYDEIKLVDDYVVVKAQNKFGLLTLRGGVLLPVDFEEIRVEKNYIAVKKNGRWGVCNLQGKLLDEINYDKIDQHAIEANVVELLSKNSIQALLNMKTGKKVLLSCDYVYYYDDVVLQYKTGRKHGLVLKRDFSKNTGPVFDSIVSSGNVYVVKRENAWAILDMNLEPNTTFIVNQLYMSMDDYVIGNNAGNFVVYDKLKKSTSKSSCKETKCLMDSLFQRKQIKPVLQMSKRVVDFSINADTTLMLSSDNNGNITLWNLLNGEQIDHYCYEKDPHYSATGSNDLSDLGFLSPEVAYYTLYSSGGGGKWLHLLSLKNFNSEIPVKPVTAYCSFVFPVYGSGDKLLIGAEDQDEFSIFEYNIYTKTSKQLFKEKIENVHTYHVIGGVTANAQQIAYYDQISKQTSVFDVKSKKIIFRKKIGAWPGLLLPYSGNSLFVSLVDSIVQFDLSTGKIKRFWAVPANKGVLSQVSQNEIMFGDNKGQVASVNLTTGKSTEISGLEEEVHGIGFLKGGMLVSDRYGNWKEINWKEEFRFLNNRYCPGDSLTTMLRLRLPHVEAENALTTTSLNLTNLNQVNEGSQVTKMQTYYSEKNQVEASFNVVDQQFVYINDGLRKSKWRIHLPEMTSVESFENIEQITFSADQKFMAVHMNKEHYIIRVFSLENRKMTSEINGGRNSYDWNYGYFSTNNSFYIYFTEMLNNSVLNVWDLKAGKLINNFNFNRYTWENCLEKNIFFINDTTIKMFDKEVSLFSNEYEIQFDYKQMPPSMKCKYFITDKYDSSLYVYNYTDGFEMMNKKGEKVATLRIIDEDDYILVTPDNYYFSTVTRNIPLLFNKNNTMFPFEQFDLKYNRPDIILERMGYADSLTSVLYHNAYLKRLKRMNFTEEMLKADFNIPEIQLKNFKSFPVITDSSELNLDIHIKDNMYKLDRINVFMNGVPVFGTAGLDLRKENKTEVNKNIKLLLSHGQNRIELSVLNQAGAESYKTSLNIAYVSKQKVKPDLYLVTIGDSKYSDKRFDLAYAAKDANDIQKTFEGNDSYKKVYAFQYTNEQVTKENILKLKQELLKARRDDIVIVAVAGHGVLDKDLNYYLATYDMDFNNPAEKGLPYEDLESLVDGIAPLKKVIFIDACHSGEVDKEEVEQMAMAGTNVNNITFRTAGAGIQKKNLGLKTTSELMGELFTDLRRGTGATVISSAGGAEYAMESDQWKNGLFTYCLLHGLKDKTADLNEDGQVMLSELQHYLRTEVTRLSNGAQQPTSRMENISMDFRIW